MDVLYTLLAYKAKLLQQKAKKTCLAKSNQTPVNVTLIAFTLLTTIWKIHAQTD